MEITSSAFGHGGQIPTKYTCNIENISPAFVFEEIPDEAQSLVLIMDDPDVPKGIMPAGG